MKTIAATTDATLAKPLAPEDVRLGDYVAVLDEEYEYPAIVWSCDHQLSGEERVYRVRLRPRDPSVPLRVIEACLPYLFVQTPKRKSQTLDLRSVRLVRLDRGYAKRVWKALRGKRKCRS